MNYYIKFIDLFAGSGGFSHRFVKAGFTQLTIKALLLVKDAYNSLINMVKPIIITRSLIGTKIHKRALITKQIDKISKTKKYLELIYESTSEFRLRRLVHEKKVEISE